MADLLQTAAAWLAGQLKEHVSQSVVYKRGAQSVTVTATIARTLFQADDGTGVIDRQEVRDFLIDVAELLLGGAATTPRRGDTIEWTIGGTLCTFEVGLGDRADPAYEYADAYRTKYRVHTRQLSGGA